MLENKCVGVAIGTTVGSILNDVDFYREYRKKGTASMTAVDNYFNGNLASAVHAFLGTKGPAVTVANACTSGADAIGIAMAWIRVGLCDIAIAGGADEINEVPLSGFRSLGILSESLCSPFDRNRSGLNLGEGAAVLVLETERSAMERGVRPRASLEGYGTANDGGHLTAPDRQGRGLDLALRIALKEAALSPEEIAFVNAHGTATEDNDFVEGVVFKRLFGDQVKFLSTKGYTGHTLGAAGSLEAAFTVLALEQEWIPASIGFEQADPRIGLSPVTERTPVVGCFALSTSVGFGGSDAALVCKRVDGDSFFS
jgi:3-oxoacyl-(acyl-carrier-protein) synthase